MPRSEPILEADINLAFPYREWRKGQREAVLRVAAALSIHDDVILSAATGGGKSGMAVTLAKAGGPAYIASPLVSLVNQYASTKEFYGDDFFTLTGRSNYQCTKFLVASCADKLCHLQTIRTGQPNECTYTQYLGRFRGTRIGNSTLMLLLALRGVLQKRKLLIIDEAHKMFGDLQRSCSVDVRDTAFDLPTYESFQDYLPWLTKVQKSSTTRVEEIKKEILDTPGFDPQLLSEMRYLNELAGGIEVLQTNHIEYVTTRHRNWDKVNRRSYEVLTFTPVEIHKLIRATLFQLADQRIYMSATPPTPAELGVPAHVVEVPDAFPAERRPVSINVVGPMGRKDREKYIGAAARKIIALKRGKTLVHAGSYALAARLYEEITALGVKCILQDRSDRIGSLEAWKDNDVQIFLSVNQTDGIDLPDDLCRTSIIACVPFPNLGDAAVTRRLQLEGKGWFNAEAARSIIQACGRGVRHEKDWAVTHILDANFVRMLWHGDQKEKLFPKWFRDAVIVANSSWKVERADE